jgi:hypothetical protein
MSDALGDLLADPHRFAQMMRLLAAPRMRELLEEEMGRCAATVKAARAEHGAEPLPEPFHLMTGIAACIEVALAVSAGPEAARLGILSEALLRLAGPRPPSAN